jgi:hypothetical protein
VIELAYLLRCPPALVRELSDVELATLAAVVKDANG